MNADEINAPVYALDDDHPAKKFLNAFIDCKDDCVGLDYDWDGQEPIDQAWQSATDSERWTFARFAYSFLSLDLILDGFLQHGSLTEAERALPQHILHRRTLMHECAAAAKRDDNTEIVKLTDQVLAMLDLWEQYLDYRRDVVSGKRKP